MNLQKPKYSGNIKATHRKNIRKAIEWLVACSAKKKVYCKIRKKSWYFRVNFITLTLASKQIHCDKTIKRECLDKFIQAVKNSNKGWLYVWRCEPQKNGNIHFHIIGNKYIQYEWLRNVWNKMQNRLGYVDRFALINGHSNPNSTDIHSITNVKNIAAYIAKYCTKDVNYRPICGKLYGMSDSLSKGCALVFTDDMAAYKELCELVVVGRLRSLDSEYVVMYPYGWHSLLSSYNTSAGSRYQRHLQDIHSGSGST